MAPWYRHTPSSSSISETIRRELTARPSAIVKGVTTALILAVLIATC